MCAANQPYYLLTLTEHGFTHNGVHDPGFGVSNLRLLGDLHLILQGSAHLTLFACVRARVSDMARLEVKVLRHTRCIVSYGKLLSCSTVLLLLPST